MYRLRTLEDVNELLSRHVTQPSQFVKDAYKLDRMRSLMAALGNPQDFYKCIHVAGTSGKTSTSYYIAAMLKAAGKKVGLTVSPHVDDVNERVQINLKPLPENKFCSELNIFMGLLEKIDIKPTYFELLVAFAFWQFKRAGVEYAVIEVGLGGLLDGTNVITRSDKVCAITDIDLDHTEVLGNTIAEITVQKAGIIQQSNRVIMHKQPDEVMKIVNEKVVEQSGELTVAEEASLDNTTTALPFYQQRNFKLALAVYKYLQVRDNLKHLDDSVVQQLAKTYIPARMEIVEYEGKTIIMDGAHNAQKMRALAESLKAKYSGQKIATLLAVVESPDFTARTDLGAIIDLSDHIILTSFGGKQDLPKVSVDPERVSEHCRQMGFKNLTVVKSPEVAFSELLKRSEPLLLITGSFYLMNHVRPLIRSDV